MKQAQYTLFLEGLISPHLSQVQGPLAEAEDPVSGLGCQTHLTPTGNRAPLQRLADSLCCTPSDWLAGGGRTRERPLCLLLSLNTHPLGPTAPLHPGTHHPYPTGTHNLLPTTPALLTEHHTPCLQDYQVQSPPSWADPHGLLCPCPRQRGCAHPTQGGPTGGGAPTHSHACHSKATCRRGLARSSLPGTHPHTPHHPILMCSAGATTSKLPCVWIWGPCSSPDYKSLGRAVLLTSCVGLGSQEWV